MCKWVVDVRVLVEDEAIWDLGLEPLGDAYMSGLSLYFVVLNYGGKDRTNVTLIRVPCSLIRRAYDFST